MELKNYQIKILNQLSLFLNVLTKHRKEKINFFKFQKQQNKETIDPLKTDYCFNAWNETKSLIPIKNDQYFSRKDGLKNEIPNLCFKVPTGGGKTLLAAHALMLINQDYFKKNNGFLLWLVPSETIYRQTLKNLRNKEHEYRKVLDRVSGGKTIIFEKDDPFTKSQVDENLCVMILMLQSGSRKTKEFLKLFRDSGSFKSFFPEDDNYDLNKKLLDNHPNLDLGDLVDKMKINYIDGFVIKHSIGNVLKILKPIIIIDEGHRARTSLATDTINNFNPKFILELSATPQPNSNIICEISGKNLKDESMIKLPINLVTNESSDWKHTLSLAVKKNKELNKIAIKCASKEGKYIRPILLIKAQSKKKDSQRNHVEEIKNYLIKNLEVKEDEIKIKLSGLNQLVDHDLLSKYSRVKYIITKDALKEGWDCPFAYCLAILSKTQNENSLTQLTGRVLRQPYAKLTNIKELNEAYVFCNNIEVNNALQSVKKALENEGYQDLTNSVVSNTESNLKNRVTQKLNKKLKKSLFLPILLTKKQNCIRKFDFYKDILSEINWSEYSFDKIEGISLDKDINEDVFSKIDLGDKNNQLSIDFEKMKIEDDYKLNENVDMPLITSIISEKINNPWHAYRIINNTIEKFLNKGTPKKLIASNILNIVNYLKNDCYDWFIKKSENVFSEKLNNNEIILKIEENTDKMRWTLLNERQVTTFPNEYPIELKKNIYKPQFKSSYNEFEYAVATYINSKKSVKWWHRLSTQGTDYSISGWKPNNVYPDFLIKLDTKNKQKLYFVETKGDHLMNEDTLYKQKLFKYLNDILYKNQSSGSLTNNSQNIEFQLILEKNWKNNISSIVN